MNAIHDPLTVPRTAAQASEEPRGWRVRAHLRQLREALSAAECHAERLEAWGLELAARLGRGQRLLVAGNGGSAAEAQHLTAELVGRYRDDRPAFSAIALNAETSSVTALGNDFGFDEVFARQVTAHAREGDVLLLLSTSGSSPNLVSAVRAARRSGCTVWALTGPAPNPLQEICDDAVCLASESPHVQEFHLAAIHAICEVFDAAVSEKERS